MVRNAQPACQFTGLRFVPQSKEISGQVLSAEGGVLKKLLAERPVGGPNSVTLFEVGLLHAGSSSFIFLNFYLVLLPIHTLLYSDFVDDMEDSLAVQIKTLLFQLLFLVKNCCHYLRFHTTSNKSHTSYLP